MSAEQFKNYHLSFHISPILNNTDMFSFFEITQDDLIKNVNALKKLPQS